MVKKLNPIIVQDKLLEKQMTTFTPLEFKRLFDVSDAASQKFIHQYVRKNFFIKLRNGLYCLKSKQPNVYALANRLYQPSYLSLETALSFYGIIPEVVYSLTSITTRTSREFIALGQSFTYTRLKPEVFQGYFLKTDGFGKFFIAEAEKALVDYLYLVSLGLRGENDRLNIRSLKKRRIKFWAKNFNNHKLDQLISKLYAHQRTD